MPQDARRTCQIRKVCATGRAHLGLADERVHREPRLRLALGHRALLVRPDTHPLPLLEPVHARRVNVLPRLLLEQGAEHLRRRDAISAGEISRCAT